MADKAVWEMKLFAIISSIVAFGFGIALGAISLHEEKASLWLEHAEAACHPFAVEHADFNSFYFECAEIENDF